MKKCMLLVALSSVSIAAVSAEKFERDLKYESENTVSSAVTSVDKSAEQAVFKLGEEEFDAEAVEGFVADLERFMEAVREYDDKALITHKETFDLLADGSYLTLEKEFDASQKKEIRYTDRLRRALEACKTRHEEAAWEVYVKYDFDHNSAERGKLGCYSYFREKAIRRLCDSPFISTSLEKEKDNAKRMKKFFSNLDIHPDSLSSAFKRFHLMRDQTTWLVLHKSK